MIIRKLRGNPSVNYKIYCTQEELEELHNGLRWSHNESMRINMILAEKLEDQLQEFIK